MDIKFRGSIILIVLIGALYYAFPTYRAYQLDVDPQTVDNKVNLGLDLQGGMYLDIEIKAEEAVKETLRRTALELEDLLIDEQIDFVEVRQTTDLLIVEMEPGKKVNFEIGDFTTMASEVKSFDIVTLDKVICCYDDMSELVGLSSKIARKIYAVIYPRSVWWTKLLFPMMNFYPIIKGNSFRVFIHPTEKVEEILFDNGFKRNYYTKTFFWQIAIFTR